MIWLIAKDSLNILKSFDIKCVALSEIIVSGQQDLANSSCKILIIIVDVGLLHFSTSGHLVKLSITIRLYRSSMGPAKSTHNLAYGLSVVGQFIGRALATREHFLDDFTIFSMSLSIFGQFT